jgi:hypothetical protein
LVFVSQAEEVVGYLINRKSSTLSGGLRSLQTVVEEADTTLETAPSTTRRKNTDAPLRMLGSFLIDISHTVAWYIMLCVLCETSLAQTL